MLLVMASLLALGATALPANAGPPRSFGTDYTGTGLAGASGLYVGSRCAVECVSFTVAPRNERRIRISVTDSSGRPVGWVATVGNAVAASGCGTAVVPAKPRQTWWVQTAVLDSCAAAPTRGRLVVELLR